MATASTSTNADLTRMVGELLQAIRLQSASANGGENRGISGISFDKYDESVEDFDTYMERLTAFFDTQSVPEARKVSCFVSLIGPKLFTLLKNLLYPVEYSSKTFDELKAILKDHLCPPPLIIPSRHAFLNRKQHEGESVSMYMAELRKLATPCKYDHTMLNIMLRDVFVSGLRAKSILDRLFEEDDISLSKTIKLALAIEKATCGTNEILHTENPTVNRVGNYKKSSAKYRKSSSTPSYKPSPTQAKYRNQSTTFKQPPNIKIRCLRCGKFTHSAKECTARNLHCTFCNAPRHVAEVCLKKKFARDVRNVAEEGEEEEILPIYAVQDSQGNQRFPPILVPVDVNGIRISFEVDTGSPVTIISEKVFKTIPKLSQGILHPTTSTFKDYNSKIITPMGEAVVRVTHNDLTRHLKLYVMKGNYASIMGRSWTENLRILSITKSVNNVTQCKQNFKIDELLEKFSPLFSDVVKAVKNYTYSVELKDDAQPVFKRPRPVALTLLSGVERELQRLENDGVISKTTFSDWATPIVPVRKPNGDIRICADYSDTVNPVLKVPQYPFPGYEEISSRLNGGQAFTTLDVTTAFLHIPVTEESSNVLCINTHKGLYKVHRLLYGISSAPAVWQKYIESVIKDVDGVVIVHDDIIVTGKSEAEHLQRLELVFTRLSHHGIQLNKTKCRFLQEQVKFLGHLISSQGIKKTTDKVDAIIKCEAPKNPREVLSFLGMVKFYAKFCNGLSTIAEPLNDLTRSNVPFVWTKKHQVAFEKIKDEIASDRILMHYSPDLPLTLSVDASPVGLGAVLAHRIGKNEYPLAFASRTLRPAEKNYSQIDKEALAIRWGVEKFYNYVYGRLFILITDHRPLLHIFGKKRKLPSHTATRLLHYAIYLQMFEFDIEYRKSEQHGNADFLSRLPLNSQQLDREDQPSIDDITVFHLEQINTLPTLPQDIRKATLEDPETREIYKKLEIGDTHGPNDYQFSLQAGCIFNGIRVYIPKSLRPRILQDLHEGHMGIVKMKALARSVVYWPRIDHDIEELCRNCAECLSTHRQPKKVEKHFWEYPAYAWERIHVDFAGPFMGHQFFLVVDSHSKWLEAFVVPSTSSDTAISILETLFSRYGFPRTLVSDNGTAFTSLKFQNFMKKYAVKHIKTAPFHPASNGQAERYVFTLKQALRAMKNYAGGLQHRLNVFLMAYRRTPNITTGESPSKRFLQREIRSKLDILKPDVVRDVADQLRKSQVSFMDRSFNVGDPVAVRDYRTPDQKWAFGTVVSKDGTLHYTILVNGQTWRRHVDQIRKRGSLVLPSQPPRGEDTVAVTGEDIGQDLAPIQASVPSPVESLLPSRPSIRRQSGIHIQAPEDRRMSTGPRLQQAEPSRAVEEDTAPLRRSARVRKPVERLQL
ncbi:Hypothetical Protein NTJ_00167 [Nesidiocoris tenuis]|uniref:RNA-directed DNA polymerase n=2 Tax=Nesidiocoris tenuis TaxID=355587 RepID=A0ABN7A7Y6_9HEMI|nr:Hypothetical Protein NTJ_00167 [Nesidiocoris tenuis]